MNLPTFETRIMSCARVQEVTIQHADATRCTLVVVDETGDGKRNLKLEYIPTAMLTAAVRRWEERAGKLTGAKSEGQAWAFQFSKAVIQDAVIELCAAFIMDNEPKNRTRLIQSVFLDFRKRSPEHERLVDTIINTTKRGQEL